MFRSVPLAVAAGAAASQSVVLLVFHALSGSLSAEVRVVTRSVEGLHAQISRVLKRAPAAKMPYISFELRLKQLTHMAYFKPAVTRIISRRQRRLRTYVQPPLGRCQGAAGAAR